MAGAVMAAVVAVATVAAAVGAAVESGGGGRASVWDAAYPYYYGDPYGFPVYPDDDYANTAPAPVIGSGAAPTPNWYYCESAKDYYPRVSQCPESWRLVPAVPSGPAQ
jgi:hypothetical protein